MQLTCPVEATLGLCPEAPNNEDSWLEGKNQIFEFGICRWISLDQLRRREHDSDGCPDLPSCRQTPSFGPSQVSKLNIEETLLWITLYGPKLLRDARCHGDSSLYPAPPQSIEDLTGRLPPNHNWHVLMSRAACLSLKGIIFQPLLGFRKGDKRLFFALLVQRHREMMLSSEKDDKEGEKDQDYGELKCRWGENSNGSLGNGPRMNKGRH